MVQSKKENDTQEHKHGEPTMARQARQQAKRRKGEGYLFKRGSIFYVEYTVRGKKKAKSLATTNRIEAERRAKELLEPAMRAKTKEEVVLHVAKARQVMEKSRSTPLSAVWTLYEKSQNRPESSPGTMRNYKRDFEKFKEPDHNRN
jgi:hypothetical protein